MSAQRFDPRAYDRSRLDSMSYGELTDLADEAKAETILLQGEISEAKGAELHSMGYYDRKRSIAARQAVIGASADVAAFRTLLRGYILKRFPRGNPATDNGPAVRRSLRRLLDALESCPAARGGELSAAVAEGRAVLSE